MQRPATNKQERRSFRDYLLPAFICLLGLFVVLAAADVIPSDPQSFHGPRWVVAMFGMLFVFAGLVLAFAGYPRIRYALATLLVLNFAAGAAWVSLFSIPEQWSGGIPFLSARANGMIAKGFVGLAALLLFYAFVRMVIRLIRGDIPKLPER